MCLSTFSSLYANSSLVSNETNIQTHNKEFAVIPPVTITI